MSELRRLFKPKIKPKRLTKKEIDRIALYLAMREQGLKPKFPKLRGSR